jgi:trigger factor
MKTEKKDLGKAQIELVIELTAEEFEPYLKKGAEAVSANTKIEGFRPGKVPYEILKQKIGEMTIYEEAAHIAIRKTLDQAIKEQGSEDMVGQPKVEISKLAPGNPFVYKAVFAVLPEIRLGD